MLASDFWEISRLEESFSCWDQLSLDDRAKGESKIWEDQCLKSGNAKLGPDHVQMMSWNLETKVTFLEHFTYLTIATLILSSDYVIFIDSWSNQFWKQIAKIKW